MDRMVIIANCKLRNLKKKLQNNENNERTTKNNFTGINLPIKSADEFVYLIETRDPELCVDILFRSSMNPDEKK
uniref:Uncharacterized protein n=1 Tax=Rhizophagus irregularis (strain DAOM 181602 / DAOM 197198 / MUCL 43194) TaxID=747089 RepID=U9SSB8_RHIID